MDKDALKFCSDQASAAAKNFSLFKSHLTLDEQKHAQEQLFEAESRIKTLKEYLSGQFDMFNNNDDFESPTK